MADDMIERVASALEKANRNFLATGRTRATSEKWNDMARAAIKAMREPTEAMEYAAQDADCDHSPHDEWLEQEWPQHKEIHRAMIDAALSSQTGAR